MEELHVVFNDPEHGWIGISVKCGGVCIEIDADSKSNSFYGLVSALTGLLDKPDELAVLWLEEPDVTEWIFNKKGNEVWFTISGSTVSRPLLRITGSYQRVCFPFWRALVSLRDRFTEQELIERTQDEFPFQELNELTTRLEKEFPSSPLH